MANLANAHDSTNGATSSVLAAGEYVIQLVKSEMTPTKKNPDNQYLDCEFAVTEGPREGARVFHMFNLIHDNPKAKDIADRHFNSLCQACGKLRSNVTDSEELHGIPVRVNLIIETDDYGEKNKIKGGVFKPLNAASDSAAQQGSGQAGGKPKPWQTDAA